MSESKYIDLNFCLGNTQSGGRILQNGISLINPFINNIKIIQEAGSPTNTEVNTSAISDASIADTIEMPTNAQLHLGGNSDKLLPLVYQL
jgi:hypothetical protein